jgi:hypothetical protein
VTHAFKHAVRTPRPEQDRDSDDEAVAAARAKACAAYTEARECDEGRVRRVLRRLRADAASESLAHWDAIVQALEALDALNARTRAYAARVVGDEKADRLGRRHYSLALFEDEQDDEALRAMSCQTSAPTSSAPRRRMAKRRAASTWRRPPATRARRTGTPRRVSRCWTPSTRTTSSPTTKTPTRRRRACPARLPFEDDIVLSDASSSSSSCSSEEEEEEDEEA